ncbi:hypothetical protein [Nostoc sp.]
MTRMLAWTDEAWADYLYWQRQDKRLTNSTHEKFPNLGNWFIDICFSVFLLG